MTLVTFRDDYDILNVVLEDGLYYKASDSFHSYDARFSDNDGLTS